MEESAHVLLIGHDQGLLDVRAGVLMNFWPVATAPVHRSDAPLGQSDLVVLCHTIPEEERQQWIDRARSMMPQLLIVKLNGFDAGPHGGADATVGLAGGPGALVSAIYGLLTERGLASRSWASHESGLML